MGSHIREDGAATTVASESESSQRRAAGTDAQTEPLTPGYVHSMRLATVGALTAGLVHQMNGPLAYAMINTEDLALGARDESSRSAARAVQEGLAIIRDLVRDVLLLARPEPRALTVVDLGELVRAACRIGGARVRAVAQLECEIGPAPRVRGDASGLLHALVNVLLNAADACERAGERRAVRVCLSTDRQGNATIAVSDDANGIDAVDAARVFDLFFTTKPGGKGTGLGLPLARRAVEQTSGRITFESAKGKGTTVTMTLPRVEDDERT